MSQRTESLTDHSEQLKLNAVAEEDDEDSLFGSDTEDKQQPAVAALVSSALRGKQDTEQPRRSGAPASLQCTASLGLELCSSITFLTVKISGLVADLLLRVAAADNLPGRASTRHGSFRDQQISAKLPLGSDSQLFGEPDDDNITHRDLGRVKRSSAGTAGIAQAVKKQRLADNDRQAILESQGVSPTPHAAYESPSQQSLSQELAASIPSAPESCRKQVEGAVTTGYQYGPRKDSEPLVRETIPAGGRSPHTSQSDLSDPDSVRVCSVYSQLRLLLRSHG